MSGQIVPRPRATTAQAVIAVLVVLSLVTGGWRVWSAEGDLVDAAVVLRVAQGTTIAAPGRAPRPGVVGESLAKGSTVSTDATGRAELDVRGRRLRLAPDTTVGVPDGATADLLRGAVLVDRREGPGITVLAGAVTVDEVDPGAVRIERGFSLRLAVLSGGARARTTGRRLDVPALHQLAVAGQALPDRALPLRLIGDDWEREVIPGVTSADVALTRLARGLDADARLATSSSFAVLPAAYRAAAAGLPSDAGRSEAVLPVAIGEAASGADAVERAVQARRDGGSWGVVAGIVGARSADVTRVIADLLAAPSAVDGAEVVAGGAPGSGTPSGAPSTGGAAPSSRPTARPTSGGSSPTASPSPTPSPSSTVDEVVETVRRLLPTPLPIVGGLPVVGPLLAPSPS